MVLGKILLGAGVVVGVGAIAMKLATDSASAAGRGIFPRFQPGEQPRNLGVPFAAPTGVVWPVRDGARSVPYVTVSGKTVDCGPCAFGAPRHDAIGDRRHAAIDLPVIPNQEIVATESGTVLGQIGGYVGLGTVVVEHPEVVIVYAEIALDSLARAGLKAGDHVQSGQTIGYGARNADGGIMLHFETWRRGFAPKFFTRWAGTNGPPPAGLLDPTMYLLTLKNLLANKG